MTHQEYRKRMEVLQNDMQWALMEDARATDVSEVMRIAQRMFELRQQYGSS